MKVKKDIEALLVWAYRDELSKRQTSAAEGIWDRIEDNGQRGGIDPGHGAAQRYAHFGLPDPDAETIERAVGQLDDVLIDWAKSIGPIGGDLAGLVSVNDLSGRPESNPGKKTTAGWTDRRTGKWQQAESKPRDVLLVGTIRPKALVTMHAIQNNRPDWYDEIPKPYQVRATKGPNAKVVGECEGKNRYALGSYCPLQWDPSPMSVIMARAEYAAWWESLVTLSETLDLKNFIVLPPAAPPAPWREPPSRPRKVVNSPAGEKIRHLPLSPMRERMLAHFKRPKASPVRYPLSEAGR